VTAAIVRALALSLCCVAMAGGAPPSQAVLPAFVVARSAKPGLSRLWARSLATRRERVACLGGTVASDTVRVERVLAVEAADADSLTAGAWRSITECAPPRWIGTVHTHVRSTDDPSPAPRFSPGDRAVMSEWSRRWGRAGAFCVLYSERSAHCEVYPPRTEPLARPPGRS